MATTTDSSVLMNLNEIFEMETERRVSLAAAEERAKAEAAARAEAERRAHEALVAQAKEEERRRAEQERARRDAELDGRIATLRAELEAVRSQREQARLEVVARAAEPAPARRGNWLASTMAAASLVAALSATVVAWPRAEQPPPAPAPVAAVEASIPESPVASATADEPSEPVVAAVEAPSVEVTRPARPGRARPPRVQRTDRHDLASELDLGDGDEVLSDEFLRGAGH